jgi:tight adherence protein B
MKLLLALLVLLILLLAGKVIADRLNGKTGRAKEVTAKDPTNLATAENPANPPTSLPGNPAAPDSVSLSLEWDYRHYRLRRKEYAAAFLAAGLLASLLALLFYHSAIAAALVFPLGLLYPKRRAVQVARKRREELNMQFKQALYSLSSLLSAGQSVENAFRGVTRDLLLIYPNPETPIIREMERIVRRMDHGVTIEAALRDFAERSGLEDVVNFAEVFSVSKRTGGNLVEVVRRTSQIIAEKIEVKQEIAVMMAQKKFESRILSGAPVAIVAFLSLSSPDYMQPLYGNPRGIAIMTVCLAALGGCFWISQRLMQLDI